MAIPSVELEKCRTAISNLLDAVARIDQLQEEISSCATTAGGLTQFLTPYLAPGGVQSGDLSVAQAVAGLQAATRITIAPADLQALQWMRNK